MKIRTNGQIFIALAGFEHKDALKQAGFWWHPGKDSCRYPATCDACKANVQKFWWTNKLEIAWKLRDHFDPTQKEQFETMFAGFVSALALSRATDANIDVPVPAGRSYLGYQKAGIAYALQRKRTLIADEMGLGKTVQALGVINATLPNRVLIICPKSLRGNWANEIKQWLVKPYRVLLGYDPERDEEYETMGLGGKEDASGNTRAIWILTFEDARKWATKQLVFPRWDLIIADEAQALKNPKAEITKRIVGFTAKDPKTNKYVFNPGIASTGDRVLFLTGTPLMNMPVELQPIAQVCDPAFEGFGFLKRYCGARQERAGAKLVWKFDGASNMGELQERLRSSFMIRRLKAEVLTELPEKTRKLVLLPTSKNVHKIAEKEAEVAREMGFSYGDETFEFSSSSAKFDELAALRLELGLEKVKPAIEYVELLLEEVEKVIVFAHHKSVAYAIADAFAGVGAVHITGDVSEEERTAAVEAFQKDPKTRVFVGTIAAAGVGLTLTASSNVVMVEQPWRPGDVIQAEDRAHRIGQKDSVLCHHLVFDGTLDMHMVQTIARKKNIADTVLDKPVEQVQVPAESTKASKPRKPVVSQVSDEKKAELLASLRILAERCDGAVDKDGAGFNAFDSKLGKSLAACESLTDAQANLASKMLKKYKGQLGAS